MKAFPDGSDGENFACNAGDPDSIPGSGRSPEEGMIRTPAVLPEEYHGQRSLVSYSSWVCQELHTTEQLSIHR